MYTKSIGSSTKLPATWLNYEQDTLYLDWGQYQFKGEYDTETRFEYFPSDLGDDVKRVQHLAMYGGEDPEDFSFEDCIYQAPSVFGKVKTLTMAPPGNNNTDLEYLAFLEHSDAVECRGYEQEYNEDPFHPLVRGAFRDLEPCNDIFDNEEF